METIKAGIPRSGLLWLAAAELALHFAGSGRYGFFRDELYYIACGDHLAWGYVDQPPLIAVVARLSRFLLGDSLTAYRFFPALAGACVVLLTGWMARELGGGRFAQMLAGLTILLAPSHLAFASFLSMNAFEPVIWMVCISILIRILKGGDARLWLLFGAVAGIGLLNKHTTLVFGFAVLAGLILTRQWQPFRNQWFWIGGLLAFAIFLPNLIWEARNGWPQIEVVRNAQEFKNTPIGPLRFLGEQVLFLNPIAFPVLAAGFGWLFFAKAGRRFRCLGWALVVVLAVFIMLKGKTYYPLPAFPMLIAAGGVGWEAFPGLLRRKWLRLAYPAVLVVSGIATIPYGVPVLPVETFLRYADVLQLARAVKPERDSDQRLTQLYADMFGWESMTVTVAAAYQSLPPAERARCAILAGNYGEAGAIDLFGARHGLPKAISGHNNYYLWGPRGYTGEVAIVFGEHAEFIKSMFEQVELAGTITSPYAVPAEQNLPVYICRRPKVPLAELWAKLRFYI